MWLVYDTHTKQVDLFEYYNDALECYEIAIDELKRDERQGQVFLFKSENKTQVGA